MRLLKVEHVHDADARIVRNVRFKCVIICNSLGGVELSTGLVLFKQRQSAAQCLALSRSSELMALKSSLEVRLELRQQVSERQQQGTGMAGFELGKLMVAVERAARMKKGVDSWLADNVLLDDAERFVIVATNEQGAVVAHLEALDGLRVRVVLLVQLDRHRVLPELAENTRCHDLSKKIELSSQKLLSESGLVPL